MITLPKIESCFASRVLERTLSETLFTDWHDLDAADDWSELSLNDDTNLSSVQNFQITIRVTRWAASRTLHTKGDQGMEITKVPGA